MTQSNIGLLTLAAALLGALLMSPARGHEWYSVTCCSGQDCAPIPFETVIQTREGYVIQLRAGEHPLVDRLMQFEIPYGDPRIKVSQDGHFHGCVYPGHEWLRCLYVPFAGMTPGHHPKERDQWHDMTRST